jgi:hypothetical protein
MANTVFSNEVLASQLKDNLATAINYKTLMKVDTSLAEEAGTIKKVITYTYTGKVEKLAAGAKNTVRGALTHTTNQYEVQRAQQVWDYTDVDFMNDPTCVDHGIKGGANLLVNDIVADYFTEAEKATLEQEFSTFSYDTVVDAIAKMNIEDEAGLYILISPELKAEIRKDADFKAKQLGQMMVDGAIGTVSGVPVVVSEAVPSGKGYVAHKDAITLFMKKDAEVEQDRDKEAGINTIIMRQVELVALTDATKIVKLARTA